MTKEILGISRFSDIINIYKVPDEVMGFVLVMSGNAKIEGLVLSIHKKNVVVKGMIDYMPVIIASYALDGMQEKTLTEVREMINNSQFISRMDYNNSLRNSNMEMMPYEDYSSVIMQVRCHYLKAKHSVEKSLKTDN